MSQLLWRVLIAVVGCLLLFALVPPVMRILGFENGDLVLIIRIVVGGLALLYILKGPPFPNVP